MWAHTHAHKHMHASTHTHAKKCTHARMLASTQVRTNTHTHMQSALIFVNPIKKKQGLPMAQLQSVFDAIVLSRVLYAAPAWRGYISAGEMDNL